MPASIYLKISKAPGSSKTDDFKEQIELVSCSHSIEFPMTPNERSNSDGKWHGRTKHDAFSVVKRADKASPNLMLYCSSGEEIGTATITVFGNNKNKLFTYELEKCFVTAVEVSISGDDDATETVKLAYASIKWTQGSGNSTGWDLEKNAKK